MTLEVDRHFADPDVLLAFMRTSRKPVFHKSNIMFRDVQMAVRDYYDSVIKRSLTVPQTEELAALIIERYCKSGALRQVGPQAYTLNAPKWGTPPAGTYSMLNLGGSPLPGVAEDERKTDVVTSAEETSVNS